MDNMELMRARHSVRRYIDKPIEGEALAALQQEVAACNSESGLHIQLILDEPKAFSGMMVRYGKFEGVRNYFALVGKKGESLQEKCGYYGQRIVLKAQALGLNTCWVAASYSKGKSPAQVAAGEKLLMVIALGYGQNEGTPHTSRPLEELYKAQGSPPEWFLRGVEAASLAPTAMNGQKFYFTLRGEEVEAAPGRGLYTKTDLGIAKYQFELGAQGAAWHWK